MPKVSIVVPVYNVENNLQDTVKAIQSQTLRDIEIILVDDGSTDESLKICNEMKEKDSRIKVIHQENQGVSVARNVGMSVASGDFIGFSDADDLMEKDMYETLYNNAIKNDADLSMVSPIIKNLNGKEKYFNNSKKKYLWDSREALKAFFTGNIFNIAVYTKLLRKDLAKQIRFEKGKAIHEDKLFTYQAIKKANRIFFDDNCKYIYIKRENSASMSKFSAKKFDAVHIANKIFEDISLTNDKELIDQAYVDTCMTKMLILRGIYRDKEAKIKFAENKKNLIKEIKNIDLKKYKSKFSTQKKVEIFIIQRFTILYGVVVNTFDLFFK